MIRYKLILCAGLLFVILFAGNYSAQTAVSKKVEKQMAESPLLQTNINDSVTIKSSLNYPEHNSILYDSSNIIVRSTDSTKLKEYLKDKDFKYFEDPEYTMTLWERFWEWVKRQFAKLTEYKSYYTALDIFIYTLMGLAVIAILFGIYKSEIKGLFFSNKNSIGLNASESLEDIHSIDFEKLIEEAIANKNYRYAVRLNYLRTLKMLSDREIIKWKIDKTNREFIKEIKAVPLKSKFERLTTDFEIIWYGGYEINFANFSELQLKYSDFNSLLEPNQ